MTIVTDQYPGGIVDAKAGFDLLTLIRETQLPDHSWAANNSTNDDSAVTTRRPENKTMQNDDVTEHETPAIITTHTDRDPAYALADEWENTARQAMTARDFQNAQMQLERAVVLRRRLGDRAELLRVLRSLGEAYQARDRWHRVLDTLDWIFSTFQQDPPDYAGMAGTLAEIGTTMITVGRPDSAADYLKRAVTAYSRLAEPAPIGHAEALVSWGNLLWSQGSYGQARRKFSTALALLVDVDDTLAEQVRDLLR